MRDRKLEQRIRSLWPRRLKRAHKKDFGRIFVLAGSQGYTGAAILASFAALRSGAGLVTLGCPDKVYAILARRHPEVMVRPFPSTAEGTLSEKAFPAVFEFLKTQDVLALGPGLGRNASTQCLIRKILIASPLPLVIDADGVNALAGRPEILKRCRAAPILTPHPGEFIRAFGGKKPETDSERKRRALETARKFGIIIVLKGYRTVIANPEGKVCVNPTGNPGMATGGTGDVLTGIIAALLGQKIPAFEAAQFGVYLHGFAGDLAVKEKGEVSLVASDLIEFLPKAVQCVLK